MAPSALLAALLVIAAAAHPSPAAALSDPDSARLAPPSEDAWTPPEPVPSARPWETAVRTPGKVASIPFSLLGLGIKGSLIFAEEHDVIPKLLARVGLLTAHGFLVGPSSLGDHTGWGAEVGYSPWFLRSFAANVSGTTAGYNRTHLALEASEAMLEYRYEWRPRDPFFGFGPDARHENESNFASKSQLVRLELRYPPHRRVTRVHELFEDPAVRTETHAAPRHSIRAWAGPRDAAVLDGREKSDDDPPLSVRFPALAAQQLGEHVEHFVYGASAYVDTRSGRPHWWKGWRLSTTAERYDQPLKALAFHSTKTPSVSFTRWTHEAEGGLSFWRDPRTFRLYARVEDLRDVGGPGVFLLTDLAHLGGGVGLSGFEPGRFRDADLVLGRLTYIFPVARYLEGDLHAEAGNVMRSVQDARLDDLETSYGVALRVRSADAPVGSVGVDWSRETIRLRFAVGGVE